MIDPTALDLRRTGIWLGRVRGLIGIAMLVAPGLVARAWTGDTHSSSRSTKAFVRTTGSCEIAMGLGTSIASAANERPADWLSISAIADFGDGIMLLADRRAGWLRRSLGLVALATAVAHLGLARQTAAQAQSTASSTGS